MLSGNEIKHIRSLELKKYRDAESLFVGFQPDPRRHFPSLHGRLLETDETEGQDVLRRGIQTEVTIDVGQRPHSVLLIHSGIGQGLPRGCINHTTSYGQHLVLTGSPGRPEQKQEKEQSSHDAKLAYLDIRSKLFDKKFSKEEHGHKKRKPPILKVKR